MSDKSDLKLQEYENICSDKSPTNEAAVTKKKRQRTKFSTYQLRELERAFSVNTYLVNATEESLMWRLGLSKKHLRGWYQNRRYKERNTGIKRLRKEHKNVARKTCTETDARKAALMEGCISPSGFQTDPHGHLDNVLPPPPKLFPPTGNGGAGL